MPFTEAALMEAMRLSTIAPFTVAHYTMAETKIRGYIIQKMGFHLVFLDSSFMNSSVAFELCREVLFKSLVLVESPITFRKNEKYL